MNGSDFRKRIHYLLTFFLILLFIVLIYQQAPKFRLVSPHLPTEIRLVPYYAWCSFYRMLVAYLVSLTFALSYGYVAATNARAGRIMLPALDIMQSIPVLTLFPAAIYFCVRIVQGRPGVEMATIFLIFTSQVWNMAFGVYEALATLPEDSKEAVASYGVRGWLKFREFLFPACIPKLVYNSIMSWAGGWYALTACEILAQGPVKYKLPGLGTFLATAAESGELRLVMIGLGTLIAIIVGMDVFLWRPLSVWAEKFRYEFAVSTTSPEGSWILDWIRSQTLLTRLSQVISRGIDAAVGGLDRVLFAVAEPAHPQQMLVWRWVRHTIGWVFLILVGYGCWRALQILIETLRKPWPAETTLIPAAILVSGLRLTIAYFISLAWTLPLAIWVGERERLSRFVTSLAQICAPIPPPALYPLFVLLAFITSKDVATTLLILTGMQWYLLFNLIAGVRNIPGDLKEAVKSFGIRRWDYWKLLIIPAIFPSLITGSITAWGGGWNAIIFWEYLEYNQKIYEVFGVGSLLGQATYKTGNTTMILVTLLSMITAIILLNRLFWRKAYLQAMEKYKIEY